VAVASDLLSIFHVSNFPYLVWDPKDAAASLMLPYHCQTSVMLDTSFVLLLQQKTHHFKIHFNTTHKMRITVYNMLKDGETVCSCTLKWKIRIQFVNWLSISTLIINTEKKCCLKNLSKTNYILMTNENIILHKLRFVQHYFITHNTLLKINCTHEHTMNYRQCYYATIRNCVYMIIWTASTTNSKEWL